MPAAVTAVAAVLAALVAAFAGVRRILVGARTVQGAVLHTPTDDTGIDERGVVRSVQGADIIVPAEALHGMWTPRNLERLARTYWTSLSRFTLGLVRVNYTADERYVVLLHPRLRLLTFQAPEYEMDDRPRHRALAHREGSARRAARARAATATSRSTSQRFDYPDWDKVRLHVEVEVANFYPAIASSISRWVYVNTQSRIHVIVCHGFLRLLVRRELEESPIGRFAGPDSVAEAPDPERLRERERGLSRPGPAARVSRSARRSAARSFARLWRALMRRTVPDRERMTSDSVVVDVPW